MKRRDFIIKSALTGVGISCVPSVIFADSNHLKIIDIGKVNKHHRHGNLFASKTYKINHPVLKSVCRDVFFKNGTSESYDDAYQLTLHTVKGKSTFFITNNFNSQSKSGITVKLVNEEIVSVSKNDLIIPLNSNKAISSDKLETMKLKEKSVKLSFDI